MLSQNLLDLEQRWHDNHDHYAKSEFEAKYEQVIQYYSVEKLQGIAADYAHHLRHVVARKILREKHRIFLIGFVGEKPTKGEIAYSLLFDAGYIPGLNDDGKPEISSEHVTQSALKYLEEHAEEITPIIAKWEEYHETRTLSTLPRENYVYMQLEKLPFVL